MCVKRGKCSCAPGAARRLASESDEGAGSSEEELSHFLDSSGSSASSGYESSGRALSPTDSPLCFPIRRGRVLHWDALERYRYSYIATRAALPPPLPSPLLVVRPPVELS